MKKIFVPILFAIACFCLSCEKVIDVDVENAASKLVIEGVITNKTDTQYVKITTSVPLNGDSTYANISGATVTVTDDAGVVYNFRERAPGIYSSRRLRGVPGTGYNLKVVYSGTEYAARSIMPHQVVIDSVGFVSTSIFNTTRTSAQLLFRDPVGVRNYYRFTLSVNDASSQSIFVYNDDFTDGKTVKEELFDNDLELNRGDKIKVQMFCIDNNVYKYFLGLSENESRGGASITPANPVSNITNGALGYFSAQTEQTEYISIPY